MVSTAMLCLALNVYHESRGESYVGQKAVAQVTLNRAGGDPKKVCDVVFKPYQFSWANKLTTAPTRAERARLASRYVPTDKKAWMTAKQVAKRALAGASRNVVGKADHYHTKAVNPRWNRSMVVVAEIDNHIFFRSN